MLDTSSVIPYSNIMMQVSQVKPVWFEANQSLRDLAVAICGYKSDSLITWQGFTLWKVN